jgi:signal transduction histidine kinase
MKIRTRLTLLFTTIFALITIGGSLAIYISSANYREEQFYDRIKGNAVNTARLLLQVDEIDNKLLRIIKQNTTTLVSEQILIYNSQNQRIYNSNETIDTKIDTTFLNTVRRKNSVKYREKDKEFLGIIFRDNSDKYVVIGSAIDKYGFGKLQNLEVTLVLVSLSALIITLIAGWLFAGQALKPIARVISEVDDISASKLHERLSEGNGTDEIASLAITFNKMLERLESAFKMQRNFISYASHELRTPLTAITAQLDVMLQKPRDTEYYRKVSLSILEDIQQLSILANGFLNLANASLDKSEIRFEVLRVDELLWQVRDEILKVNPGYKVNIAYKEFPEQESTLETNANDQLLKVAFSNIIDNACKYSEDKQVNVDIDILPKKIKITFADNGVGIPKEDLNKIFEPFYRANNVKPIKGHGLGLSLTHRIIKLHDGSLHINSSVNTGTAITVELPNLS